MHSTFLIVLVIVAVLGLVVSLTRLAWPFSVLDGVGRTGAWIHHADMDPQDAQPDPSVNDPAIPARRLRGRS